MKKIFYIVVIILSTFYSRANIIDLNPDQHSAVKNHVSINNDELIKTKNKQDVLEEKINNIITREATYFTYITWISGIVLAVVGLLSGLHSLISWNSTKNIMLESKRQLDEAEKLKLNIEQWFNSKKDEYEQDIKQTYRNNLIDIQNASRLEILKELLNKPKKNLDIQHIYALLTPIIESPKLEYMPTFKKIIDLDISSDITLKAQEGFDNCKPLYH